MVSNSLVLWRDLKRRVGNVLRDLRYGAVLGGRQKRQVYEDRGAYGFNNTDYGILDQMFKGIVESGDVLVDVGCGRGRVLNYWISRFPGNKIIGIELDPEYAKKTRDRLIKYSQVQVLFGDAVENLPLAGTIYYLFNPFDGDTLYRWMLRLLEKHPNPDRVRVVYYSPEHLDVLDRFAGLSIEVRGVDLGSVRSHAARHSRYALVRIGASYRSKSVRGEEEEKGSR